MIQDQKDLITIESRDIIGKDGFYVTGIIRGNSVSGFDVFDESGIIFIANYACEVLWVGCKFSVADGAANPLVLLKNLDGSLIATLNAKITTVQQKNGSDLTNTIIDQANGLQLEINDVSGQTLSGAISVYLKPINRGNYR